jgi:N-acetylglucosaminyl-diphospho-decaprenol L-rhamnosyltransferase
MAPGDPSQTATITLSLVSHGQATLCRQLIEDLARLAPPSVARLVYTANLPEAPPDFSALSFPVELIRGDRPLGFAANHNRAFFRCTTEFFAVLNPDLRFDQDPFAALITKIRDPGVGVVAPTILEADGRVADFARPLLTPWQVLRRRFANGADAHRIDWLAGMFLMLRSAVFRQIGGFDPRYRLYCEDADLCARVRLAGLRIEVAREARVTHLAQRASRRRLAPMLLHIKSLLKFWTSPAYRQYRALLRSERRNGFSPSPLRGEGGGEG